MAILKTSGLSYTRDENIILNDISVEIQTGEFVFVTGSSGSGKSTFLKMCADLISPDAGELYFKDKNYLDWNPYELRKKISYLSQTPSFFLTRFIKILNIPLL